MREIMYAVLALLPIPQIPETLPAELLRRRKLVSRSEALRRIHFPVEDTPLAPYDQAEVRRICGSSSKTSSGLRWASASKRGRRVKEAKGNQDQTRSGDQAGGSVSVLPFKLTRCSATSC